MSLAAVPASGAEEVPEIVQWWVRALLDAGVVDLVRAAGDRPVEVRLYANKGRPGRRPSVLVGVAQVDEVGDSP